MTTELSGIGLRFVVMDEMNSASGPLRVRDLVRRIERRGFMIAGRASKAVQDWLRTEVRKGRVRRISRGLYQFVTASRSTLRRFRAMALAANGFVAQTRAVQPERISPWHDHHWVWRI